MRSRSKLILWCAGSVLLLLVSGRLPAQSSVSVFGSYGPPYPLSAEWRMMSTPQTQLIFPDGYEAQAQRVARIFAAADEALRGDYGIEMPPYPLVLNTSADIANAYFGLAPRRSEWFAYPSQGNFAGPVDWYSLLTVHEGRHAGFHRELRAIAQKSERPNYAQAYLGSYSRHFPNYYHLGFPLVAYIRLEYGEDVWREILADTADWSLWPLRFYGLVKKKTGASMDELYRGMLDFLKDYWKNSEQAAPMTEITEVTGRPKHWTSYRPIGAGENGEVYAIAHGDKRPFELLRISRKGEEERLLRLVAKDGWVDVSDGWAVWSETVPHPMWTKVSESRLVLYRLKNGEREIFQKGGHFQAPILSPDGKRIAAVEVKPGGAGEIVVFDRAEGNRLAASAPPQDEGGAMLLHPAWSPDGKRIAVVAAGGGSSSLWEYEIAGRGWYKVLGPVREQISRPEYFAGSLLFGTDYSGREEIQAVDTGTGARYVVARRPVAAVAPMAAPDDEPAGDIGVTDKAGKRLIFADYTADGFRLVETALEANEFEPLSEEDKGALDYADPLFRQMNGEAPAEKIAVAAASGLGSPEQEAAYPAAEYRPAAHFLNFHSWGLVPAGEGELQLFAQSDDPLGLMSLQPYLGWNANEPRIYSGVQGLYRGMFPMLRFGLEGDMRYPGDALRRYSGFTGQLGAEAPLDLSRGLRQRNISLSADAFLRMEEPNPLLPGDGVDAVLPLAYTLEWYSASRAVAPADIAPPWAQLFQWKIMHVPWQQEYRGWEIEQRGRFYFPSPIPSHRFRLIADAEYRQGDEIPLSELPIRPRGYSIDWYEPYPADLVVGAEYMLPLLDPDLRIGNLYYLKRITLSLFHDVGIRGSDGLELFSTQNREIFQSTGIELSFQQHIFSSPILFEGGLRLVYRWRDETYRLEDTVLSLGFEWK